MTQYADTAVSDIDPDSTLRVRLSAQAIERSSRGSSPLREQKNKTNRDGDLQ